MAAISSTPRAIFAGDDRRGRRPAQRARSAAYCWFVDVEFANGALGHLDLTVAVRMDWHEGFQIYGAERQRHRRRPTIPGITRSSEVDIFHEADGASHRVLGADGHFYRRQLEGFADAILDGTPMTGADIDDGIASVRAMVAIARSAGERQAGAARPTCRGQSDAARDLRQDLSRRRARRRCWRRSRDAGFATAQYNMACSGLPSMPDAIPPTTPRAVARGRGRDGVRDRAVSGTYNMIASRSRGARRGLAPPGGPSRRVRGDGHAPGHALHRHARSGRSVARTIPTTPSPRPGARCWPRWRRPCAIAERHDVDLGIEPELANVVIAPPRRAGCSTRSAATGSASCSIRPISSRRADRPTSAGIVDGGDRPARRPTSSWLTPRTATPTAAFATAGQGGGGLPSLSRAPARRRFRRRPGHARPGAARGAGVAAFLRGCLHDASRLTRMHSRRDGLTLAAYDTRRQRRAGRLPARAVRRRRPAGGGLSGRYRLAG